MRPSSNQRFVFKKVRVCHERVYADKIVSRVCFVRSFFSQRHSRFSTNITSKNVSQHRTEQSKSRSFICKANLNFWVLQDTSTVILLSLWLCLCWMRVGQSFKNIHNGRVNTRFQIVKLLRVWKFVVEKHEFSLGNLLIHWWVGYFRKCNLPLTFHTQLFRKKLVKELNVFSGKIRADNSETIFFVSDSIVNWLWSTLFDRIQHR